ncbi:MAG: twin-arginine translocase TatA/TatE family subunit [Mycetocola sp.]
MGGLSFDKILIIGIIAAFLLGPDKLPEYASKLANLVKSLRRMAQGAQTRMKDEMGPEFNDINWKQMDPRQYDPRRIIRDALLEEDQPVASAGTASAGASASAMGIAGVMAGADVGAVDEAYRDRVRERRAGTATTPVPFDDEAS